MKSHSVKIPDADYKIVNAIRSASEVKIVVDGMALTLTRGMGKYIADGYLQGCKVKAMLEDRGKSIRR